ncbi:MAG: HEPN domain-containing protein [Planctomycetota bacterium]
MQAHTRAFLVLSHAEIESYLEDWAKDVARACEAVWTKSGRPTKPLAFLLATYVERISVPQKLGKEDGPQKLAHATKQLFQAYYELIKANHGIKEQNVMALFFPLGIPASAFGSTLLPNLDSLGALRGTHAHLSAQAVASVLDPETQFNKITAIVGDLKTLDAWLVEYRRSIR